MKQRKNKYYTELRKGHSRRRRDHWELNNEIDLNTIEIVPVKNFNQRRNSNIHNRVITPGRSIVYICNNCGRKFISYKILKRCPKCGSNRIKIV